MNDSENSMSNQENNIENQNNSQNIDVCRNH